MYLLAVMFKALLSTEIVQMVRNYSFITNVKPFQNNFLGIVLLLYQREVERMYQLQCFKRNDGATRAK